MFAVSDEVGQPRQGYMGHLTRIANQLVSSPSSDGIADSPAATNALLLGLLTASCLLINESPLLQFFWLAVCHQSSDTDIFVKE